MTLVSSDRILVLAPHPDDEVLGCAGIIQQAKAQGLPLRIVFFTYGDNNEWSFLVYRKHPVLLPRAVRGMGLVRHNEAIAAAKVFGVLPKHLIFLGYPDFGTLHIFYAHWGTQIPFQSMLTKVKAVPYPGAFRPGAPYKGEEILRDLKSILREFRPTKIFVSHPGDNNPDHRSLYLFTRVALWDLEKEIKPELYPYLIHLKKWPRPSGYYPDQPLEPPIFFRNQISWQIHSLSLPEIIQKEKALKSHKSQYAASAKYLSSFVRRNELFGDFPSLYFDTVPIYLLRRSEAEFLETPEELTDIEKAAFVGIEERFIHLEKDNIVISINFSRPLAKEVGVSVYIFGYRSDVAFEKMPKIHAKLGMVIHNIYDQNRKLSKKSVQIIRTPRSITLYVPLKILGYPQRIMTSANSYLVDVPLDWVSWRIAELPA